MNRDPGLVNHCVYFQLQIPCHKSWCVSSGVLLVFSALKQPQRRAAGRDPAGSPVSAAAQANVASRRYCCRAELFRDVLRGCGNATRSPLRSAAGKDGHGQKKRRSGAALDRGMRRNAFQVTRVKIHFLIVTSFHVLRVLYSTANPLLRGTVQYGGKGGAQPTTNLPVTPR